MMESKKLISALTEIDDEYIESAHGFGGEEKRSRSGWQRITGRGVVAASIALVVAGSTVYGASRLVRQLHVSAYDSVEELMREHDIAPFASVAVQGGTFDEDIYLEEQGAVALIDLINFDGTYTDSITTGSDSDRWLRKLVLSGEDSVVESVSGEDSVVESVSGENSTVESRTGTGVDRSVTGSDSGYYYEVYDYENMQDAFSDYQIALKLDYIQANYPLLSGGEYGCDFDYFNSSKTDCRQKRFVTGYENEQGQIVNLEYLEDWSTENEDPYVLYEGKKNAGYYITADGVEVFLERGTGSRGGTRVDAWVFTQHSELCVMMYGGFSQEEIEAVLDSLNIAEAMGINNHTRN